MPTIAVISYKYPPVYSGYGNQASVLIREIERKNPGIKFTILTWNFGVNHLADPNSEVVKLGSPALSFSGYFNTIVFGLLTFKWLVVNRSKFDIIHCLQIFSHAVFAVWAGKVVGKPVILKVTQTEMKPLGHRNLVSSFLRSLRQRLIRSAQLFIVISEHIYYDLKAHGIPNQKIVKIPNGVNSTTFLPPASPEAKNRLRQKLNIPEQARVILFSGALNERKGIKELICAVEINSYRVPVVLVVCGPDYGYKEELIQDIKRIRESKNLVVRYEGLVSNIHEYLGAADIFVLPSYDEGLSNALLEAAISGLGLIATSIGGNRDIVEHDVNGYLFPPGDCMQLADLIERLVYDKATCESFGIKARQKALQEYTLSEVAGRYVDLYQQMSER